MIDIQIQNGIPEIHPLELSKHIGDVKIIDVRRPEEFNGPEFHIKGAQLLTLGPDLMNFLQNANKNELMIFVCRSGGRSGNATMMAQDMGLTRTANMTGGMLLWNQLSLPVEK